MIKAIVTDIEGTTSSLSFVKDVLFPYAADKLPSYVRQHASESSVQVQLAATAKESGVDPQDIEALIAQLLQWIRDDKKITPLKALQGMIWQQGYEQGAYQAHVYIDAVEQLKKWQAEGLALYVYSSGSVYAQKLFFKYSEAGDLAPLFKNYFDTTTGPKQEAASYQKIAKAVGMPAKEVLFLSDIEGELNAAKEAGMHTAWLIRENDSPHKPDELRASHKIVTGFDQLNVSDFY